MKRKYYLSCLNCRARMRRTGKKNLVYKADRYQGKNLDTGRPVYERIRLYDREYECLNCESTFWYNEERNFIR